MGVSVEQRNQKLLKVYSVIFIVYLLFLLFGVLCASFLITGAKLVSDKVKTCNFLGNFFLLSVETKIPVVVADLSTLVRHRHRKNRDVFHSIERRKVWNFILHKKFCDENSSPLFCDHIFDLLSSFNLFLAKHSFAPELPKKRKPKKEETNYSWLDWRCQCAM